MYYGARKNKQKQKEQQQRSPRILGLGLIKLDFYLNLSDDMIKKYKLDFSKINSPKDLAFIAEDPTLLDLIQISSSDTLSNILLYINKASVSKSFVELITLSSLKIHPDEEHMKKIFTHVTEHNYLFSNEMSCTTVPNKISFAFKNGKKLLKYFDIITDYDPYIEEINNDMSNRKYLDEKSVKISNNGIKEVNEAHEQSKRKTEKSRTKSYIREEADDVLVKSDIYNEMSAEMSRRSDNMNYDDVNYKINEVNEEDNNSPQNVSRRESKRTRTEELEEENNEKSELRSKRDTRNSRFSASKNEKTEKSIRISEGTQENRNEENDQVEENFDNPDSQNRMENIEEIDMENNEMDNNEMDNNEMQNMDMENMDMENMDMENMENMDMENMENVDMENMDMDMENMENIEEKDEEKNEEMENVEEEQSHRRTNDSRKSKKSQLKILKTNTEVNDNDVNNTNNNNNEDSVKNQEMDNIIMDELEEIKDEKTQLSQQINKSSHSQINKTNLSQKKDETHNSINNSKTKTNILTNNNISNRTKNKEEDKISSNYIANNNQTKNKINVSQTTQSYKQESKQESKSRKNETLNLNDDINKINKNLYESVPDISRNDKSVTLQKLVNIPAACELEEYDFLFIDLEEFIHFHSNGFLLLELAEFLKKISSENKKPRIILNYPNILINLNVVNLDILQNLMDIMSYTDIFLFEKKECLAFFNMLSQMNYEKDISEKQVNDYFFREIPHHKSGVTKLGLFLDDLQKFHIAEQKSGKILTDISYDINLYPKINHFNQKIIDEYKKIMAINNSYFKSIFFGGYFSSYVFNMDHYQSFISGAESTKRILEIFKNKIDFPTNQEFYLIKLQKKKIEKDLHSEKLRKKEEKFVLDCINKTNSSIKYYNPLFDDNLNAFFASGIIRKQLKEKGFINTNGFVLYDSSYKSLVGVPPKIKKRLDTSDRERHLLLAIKQNKVI